MNKLQPLAVFTIILMLTAALISGCVRTDTGHSQTTDPPDSTATESEKQTVLIPVGGYEYGSLEELSAQSDWILRGTVTDRQFRSKSLPRTEDCLYYTVITMQVEEVYKGAPGFDTVEVWELGGETEDTVYTFETRAEPEPGQTYVVFLDALNPEQGTAVLNGHCQGLYPVKDGALLPNSGGFSITADDLEALKTKRDWSAPKTEIAVAVDMKLYETTDELAEASDAVVYGTVLHRRYVLCSRSEGKLLTPTVEDDPEADLKTIYTLWIHQTYQGGSLPPVIEVLVDGGETDARIVRYSDNRGMDVFESYVLFLRENSLGLYSPVGGGQGICQSDSTGSTVQARYGGSTPFSDILTLDTD